MTEILEKSGNFMRGKSGNPVIMLTEKISEKRAYKKHFIAIIKKFEAVTVAPINSLVM